MLLIFHLPKTHSNLFSTSTFVFNLCFYLGIYSLQSPSRSIYLSIYLLISIYPPPPLSTYFFLFLSMKLFLSINSSHYFFLAISFCIFLSRYSLSLCIFLSRYSLSLSLSLYLSISHLFFNFFLVADKSEFRKGVLRPKRSKNCTFCNPHFSSLSFYSVFPFSHFPPLSSSLNENIIKKL